MPRRKDIWSSKVPGHSCQRQDLPGLCGNSLLVLGPFPYTFLSFSSLPDIFRWLFYAPQSWRKSNSLSDQGPLEMPFMFLMGVQSIELAAGCQGDVYVRLASSWFYCLRSLGAGIPREPNFGFCLAFLFISFPLLFPSSYACSQTVDTVFYSWERSFSSLSGCVLLPLNYLFTF